MRLKIENQSWHDLRDERDYHIKASKGKDAILAKQAADYLTLARDKTKTRGQFDAEKATSDRLRGERQLLRHNLATVRADNDRLQQEVVDLHHKLAAATLQPIDVDALLDSLDATLELVADQ